MKTFWVFAVTLLAVQGVYGQANLSGTSATVAAAAGGSSFSLTLNPAAAWTATSTASWLTITPTSGTTSSVISYTYTANTATPARQARIDVAGQSFYVLQLGSGGAYTAWGTTVYGNIYTIAGTGAQSSTGDGGPATVATVDWPETVALDGNGNIYIADNRGNKIRRVDAGSGIITTVAGGGTSGSLGDGGPATSATLSSPTDIVLDLSGNIFIADSGNGRIRRIDSKTGIITTVAGNGSETIFYSGDGGPATAAGIDVTGLALDSAGNIYLCGVLGRVRRVDAITGIISTVAGNGVKGFSGDGGPATAASFNEPFRLTLDKSGNLFIADTYNARIRRVDAVTGTISTFAGGGTAFNGGTATSIEFSFLEQLNFDLAGNLYIADFESVWKMDAITGMISRVAGTGNDSPGGNGIPANTASLQNAIGVAPDAVGSLYIADYGTNLVRFVDFATPQLTLTTSSVNVSAAAGTGTAAFTLTPTTATWTATSNASWLTLTTASGTGSGSAAYSYTANASFTSRSGAITIAGQTFTVNQAGAAASFSTTSATAATAGDTGTFTLTVTPAAAWTASSSATWLTVSPTSGSTGGTLTWTATANTTFNSRSAAITVGSATFTVTQAGESATFSAAGASAKASGDTGTFTLTLTPAGAWTASSSATWLTVSPASGSAGGTLTWTAAANSSFTARSATITVGSAVFQVTQAGATATLSGVNGTVAAAAGSSTFSLTLTGSVAWTATTTASWLTVSPTSGTASATITYTYAANTATPARQARIDIAGKSFYVVQLGSGGAYTPWGSTTNGDVYTIAGNGTYASTGDAGPATAAGLHYPYGVALDANANMYIADYFGDRIRRVDAATQLITTIAGTGSASFSGDGGPAASATLNDPITVAVDHSGNLFVADWGNNRVRRVDALTGIITTVAGNGSSTYSGDNGPATSAGLPNPFGVVLDTSGNLYISDPLNRVRRVDAVTGLISTVAGNGTAGFSGDGGPATSASLNTPRKMAMDAAGNLFIADSNNGRIRRVDATTGVISTFAGGGSAGMGGLATSALLSGPDSVAVDPAGNLFIVADGTGVYRVDAVTGIITAVADVSGNYGFYGDGGPATNALIEYPVDVTTDGSGSAYFVDSNNDRIRFVDNATPQISLSASVATVTTSAGSGSVAFTITPSTAFWAATSNASWLTLTSSTGTGSGNLSYTYTANTSVFARSAQITIEGATFQLNQAGSTVALSATSATTTAAGGTGNFTITVTPAAPWTATSSAAWLTVSPTSGTASGTITWTAAANTSADARYATIAAGGKAFIVEQLGAAGIYTPWGPTASGDGRRQRSSDPKRPVHTCGHRPGR